MPKPATSCRNCESGLEAQCYKVWQHAGCIDPVHESSQPCVPGGPCTTKHWNLRNPRRFCPPLKDILQQRRQFPGVYRCVTQNIAFHRKPRCYACRCGTDDRFLSSATEPRVYARGSRAGMKTNARSSAILVRQTIVFCRLSSVCGEVQNLFSMVCNIVAPQRFWTLVVQTLVCERARSAGNIHSSTAAKLLSGNGGTHNADSNPWWGRPFGLPATRRRRSEWHMVRPLRLAAIRRRPLVCLRCEASLGVTSSQATCALPPHGVGLRLAHAARVGGSNTKLSRWDRPHAACGERVLPGSPPGAAR
jgi:hypothetical protein